MYTVEEVLQAINANPTQYAIAAFIVFGFGFAQYGLSLRHQIKDKRSPFYFWQHAWYIGHDFTFVILFGLWFNQVDYWLFKVLWAGCVVFVCIELLSLYLTIKHERNEVFGSPSGAAVSEKEAWIKGLTGYAIGIGLFWFIRQGIGDVMCLALMMSTNVTVAIAPAFLAQRQGSRQGHSYWLAIAILGGTIFTFCPPGIGFWATSASVFDKTWFYGLGAISLYGALNYFVVLRKLPTQKPEM